jgi:maltose O-acetyltransferase
MPVAESLLLTRRWAKTLLFAGLGSALIPMWLRAWLLSLLGIEAAGVRVAPHVAIEGANISIGRSTFIGHHSYLLAPVAALRIGENCAIASQVQLLTVTHRHGEHGGRAAERLHLDTSVGDGCWIGTGAVILPGVTVADGCVIGAGAVVTRDTTPDGLYAGVPARRVRNL